MRSKFQATRFASNCRWRRDDARRQRQTNCDVLHRRHSLRKSQRVFETSGFANVFHLEGGIIEYVRQVEELGLENKFKGKNFVFDQRLGEAVSGEIISQCHQCGNKSDAHRNCANDACHLLFIQCDNCNAKLEGCCSELCREVKNLSPEQQKELNIAQTRRDELFNNSQKRRARAFDLHDV